MGEKKINRPRMAQMNTNNNQCKSVWLVGEKENKLKIDKMKQEKMNYEAPLVEIIEVEVEKGFAMSGQGTDTNNDYDFGGRG